MKIRNEFLRMGFLPILAAASACASVSSADRYQEGFVKLNGVRIHYQEYGSGEEALVFVHCWTCDGSFWREQLPAFVGRCHVVVLDLPGHGRSDKPEIDYSMELFARALNAVLERTGASRSVLVGHSMGTPVIRQFYRMYPERTRALVAVDGSLRPFIDDPEKAEEFARMFEGSEYPERLKAFVGAMFSKDASAELRESVLATMQRTPQRVATSAMRAMLDSRIWMQDPILVPLLVVHAKSAFWPEDYEQFVRQIAPRSEYRTIEGAGHFLQLEKPDEFNAILGEFLRKLKLLR